MRLYFGSPFVLFLAFRFVHCYFNCLRRRRHCHCRRLHNRSQSFYKRGGKNFSPSHLVRQFSLSPTASIEYFDCSASCMNLLVFFSFVFSIFELVFILIIMMMMMVGMAVVSIVFVVQTTENNLIIGLQFTKLVISGPLMK